VKTRAIIFDCFGVLTTDVWRAFLDNLPAGTDTTEARRLNHAYDAGLISLQDFLEGVQKATGQKPTRVEELLEGTGEVVKNTRLLEYITQLRGRGYKIGMISNIATNWIRDTFLSAEEQALFDHMLFSYELGLTKPDPRIYRLACERLGVEPEEAIFIDDIDRYCAAAEAEGLGAIIYTDFGTVQSQLESLLTA